MYQHTQNENGSYNSRCLDCFMTIAFCRDSEEELERVETEHICLEKVLARLYAAQLAAKAYAAHN